MPKARISARRWAIGSAVLAAGAVAALSTPVAAASGTGAKSSPYSVGVAHRIDSTWSVKVVSSSYHANAAVHHADQFADPPKHGFRYVLVKVRGKCLKGNGKNLRFDEQIRLVGRKTHALYSPANALAPHDLKSQDAVSKGRHETGNVVFEVRTKDLRAHHPLLSVDSNSHLSAPPKYFKTK